jgi:N-acetylneuraminate synthase
MQPERCVIIAEAGVNHDGALEKALLLVDAAADAGADWVKFQTFSADRLVTRTARKAQYQEATTGTGETQYEMLTRLELPASAHVACRDRARARGIGFLSTPFDEEAVTMLAGLGVTQWKVPSGELTNHGLLRFIARRREPMIVSTGMATLGDVEEALAVIRAAGCDDVTVLHCTSSYPAAIDDVNLRAMATLRHAFGVKVGYSDHTLGIEVAVAAAALGASVIEKHFTLDKRAVGPDHAASLEPGELKALVTAVRNVQRALGDGVKRPTATESEVARVARRSLVAARDLRAGHVLSAADVAVRRPGSGLPPSFFEHVVGRTLRDGIAEGEPLRFEHFA